MRRHPGPNSLPDRGESRGPLGVIDDVEGVVLRPGPGGEVVAGGHYVLPVHDHHLQVRGTVPLVVTLEAPRAPGDVMIESKNGAVAKRLAVYEPLNQQ